MRIPPRPFAVALMLANLGVLGCKTQPSGLDAVRAQREYELAAGLREEGNVAGALTHLRTSLELDAEYPEAHLLLGIIKLETRNPAEAEAALAEGVRLLIDHGRLGSTLAEARNLYGVALLELQRFNDAIEPLRASAEDELNTAPHLAWSNLGLALLGAGQVEAAEQAHRTAVSRQPRFCLGFFRLAELQRSVDRLQDAEASLVAAIEADPMCEESPQFQMAWRMRGEVRAELGMAEEAAEDFMRCAELDSRSSDGRACQRYLDAIN